MAMLIMAVAAYIGISLMEKSYEEETKTCEATDWNAYYAIN